MEDAHDCARVRLGESVVSDLPASFLLLAFFFALLLFSVNSLSVRVLYIVSNRALVYQPRISWLVVPWSEHWYLSLGVRGSWSRGRGARGPRARGPGARGSRDK